MLKFLKTILGTTCLSKIELSKYSISHLAGRLNSLTFSIQNRNKQIYKISILKHTTIISSRKQHQYECVGKQCAGHCPGETGRFYGHIPYNTIKYSMYNSSGACTVQTWTSRPGQLHNTTYYTTMVYIQYCTVL